AEDCRMDAVVQTIRKLGSAVELLEGRVQTIEQERQPLVREERQPLSAEFPSPIRPPRRPSPQRLPAAEAAAAAPSATASTPARPSQGGSQVPQTDSHRALPSAIPSREPDPFKSMWAQCRFDENRQMFEKSQLRYLHDKEGMRRWWLRRRIWRRGPGE
ncbi:unnamed protein product, partial [Prorocentrum cordatum]